MAKKTAEKTILVIANSKNVCIGIPVKNFPKKRLPPGSTLETTGPHGKLFKSVAIVEYVKIAASEKDKQEACLAISTDFNCNGAGNASVVDRTWDAIAAKCVRDTTQVCDLKYPQTLEFEVDLLQAA